MSKRYASLKLGGPDANAASLGTLMTWLISNNLMSEILMKTQARAITRVRMQDLTGAGFLTTVLHGELTQAHLNQAGNDFVAHYYSSGQFDRDWEAREFRGENEWICYDELAPVISGAWRRFLQPASVAVAAKKPGKVLQFPGRFKKHD